MCCPESPEFLLLYTDPADVSGIIRIDAINNLYVHTVQMLFELSISVLR